MISLRETAITFSKESSRLSSKTNHCSTEKPRDRKYREAHPPPLKSNTHIIAVLLILLPGNHSCRHGNSALLCLAIVRQRHRNRHNLRFNSQDRSRNGAQLAITPQCPVATMDRRRQFTRPRFMASNPPQLGAARLKAHIESPRRMRGPVSCLRTSASSTAPLRPKSAVLKNNMPFNN